MTILRLKIESGFQLVDICFLLVHKLRIDVVSRSARGARCKHERGGGVGEARFFYCCLNQLAAYATTLMAVGNDYILQPYGVTAGMMGGAKGEHANGTAIFFCQEEAAVSLADNSLQSLHS